MMGTLTSIARKRLYTSAALLCALAGLSTASIADRADRSKPMNLSADSQVGNLEAGESTWSGDFRAEQGTMLLRADKAIVRRDAAGFVSGTLSGKPVTFKEKREGKDDILDARAERAEFDQKSNTLKLIGNAKVVTGEGEIQGATIIYNLENGKYEVQGGSGGRTRGIILPRASTTPAVPSSVPAPNLKRTNSVAVPAVPAATAESKP